ncbi:FecR domain-containing protein [Ferrovibrio sp.]|uniref:FecR domain-containing protein n=1 Tax=Ferrovibrio sp. TaxID=1917215 RepID=UPI001B56FECA|nr:FecR domain-containing protein [Ferrovibrio sp.]MBP7066324.1 FecR domain-containing protein [Ferrovibrio sp.]
MTTARRHLAQATLLAALPAFALFAFQAWPAAAASEPIGVAAAVNPDATGTPPQMERRIIEVGTNMLSNERVATGPNGQAQLIFNDGSAFSIGPNSELTLDNFVYDPAKGTGQMALTVTKGVFRFVGGKISKDNPVQIKVGAATMGIRGGIATLNTQPGQPTVARFLFGREMSMSQGGVTQVTTRPGTAIDLPPGAPPQPPRPVTAAEIRQANSQLEARPAASGEGGGQQQGGQQQGGQQQGGQQQASGPAAPPPPAAIEGRLDSSGVSQQNSATPPSAIVPVAPPPPPVQQQAAGTGGQINQTQRAAQQANSSVSQSQTQTQNQQAPSNSTSTVSLTGREGRFLFGNNTNAALYSSVDTNTGNATVNSDYNQPVSNFQQVTSNGVTTLRANINATPLSTATAINLPTVSSGGFTVSNMASPYGNFGGYGYNTTGRDYFYYTLTNTSNSDVKMALFGGTPTLPANFRTTGFGTYTLQDGLSKVPLLGDEVNSNTTLVGKVTASPLYTIYSANLAPSSLASGSPALGLQASIAISGQGSAQSSLMVGMTSVFASDAANNDMVLTGGVRGSYRANATDTTQRYTSSVSSAAVGSNGSAIYGSSGEYLVLTPDTLTLDPGTNSVTRTTQSGVRVQPAATPIVEDYSFVNGAVRNSTNPTVVTSPSRTTRVMQGYAAGMLESFGQGDKKLVTNSNNPLQVTLSTDASNNRLEATFNLQAESKNFKLEFGDTSGGGVGRSAFINDQLYAARDSNSRTTTLDTVAVDQSQLLMVSSKVASVDTSFMPTGTSFCVDCDNLSWGWWLANIREPSAGPVDRVHLGTYVTGVLPSTGAIPLTGSATYKGHAIGSVTNGSNRYLAVGNYIQSWNFATKTGTAYIANFDNYTFVGSPSSSNGREFNASLSQQGGTGLTGSLSGSFFTGGSNPTRNTGGQFDLTGTGYAASGTFAAGDGNTAMNFQGRFLRSDPTNSILPFSGFNNMTLRANANASYNNSTITFSRLDTSWIKANTSQGEFYFLATPQNAGYSASSLNALSPYGDPAGTLYYAADQTFFFAGLRDVADNTARTVLFGGIPTTTAQFPTTGLAQFGMGQGNNPVPFANVNIVATDAMAVDRYVSPLYSVYSSNITYAGTNSSPERAVQVQASIGIAGQGSAQQSFLVAETGNYIEESAKNSIALTGGMRGSIRSNATGLTTRLVANVTSADAGNSNAIYGSGAEHMVLTPDATVTNTINSTIDRETALAFSQPHDNLTGTSYNYFEVANKQTASALLTNTTRTTQTLNGYTAGLMEVNPTGNTTVNSTDRVFANQNDSATDVVIQTNATNNRVAASFALDDQQNAAGAHAYQLSFGSTTGTSAGSSAFVNDKIYAARDIPTSTSSTYNTSTTIDNRGIMVTHSLAQVSSNALPSGVTLCSCDYLQWGWWITDIRHTSGATNNERDRVHLATWVAGVLPNMAEIPTTGTASYNGHVAGNVNNNGARYVAFGTYNQSWNFGTKTGTATITNFDNLGSITGSLSARSITDSVNQPTNNRDFSGALSGTGISGQLAGSFFKGGTDAVKAAAGNFTLTGTNYQAAGTFAAQKP